MSKKKKEYFAAGNLYDFSNGDTCLSVFHSLEEAMKEKYDDDDVFKVIPIKVVGKFEYSEKK